ncbi:MAG: CsgG/HfaB family protein [Elusimicrobiota bacterium]
MKKFIALFTCTVLLATLGTTAFTAGSKPRMAVMPLSEGSIDHWWGNWNVGQGVSDMLVTDLVKSGKFSMIEREQLQKVMAEQQLGVSGAVNENTAAQLGKILGVDYIIVGRITQFAVESNDISIPYVGRVQNNVAQCAIDARVVSVKTAEILTAIDGQGKETKTGLSVWLSGVPHFSFGSNDFHKSILGKATRTAVTDFVAKLTAQVGGDGTIKPQQPTDVTTGAIEEVNEVLAKVADIEENIVTLNAGLDSGVKKDMVFMIRRITKVVTDPDTGEEIKKVYSTIGEVKVTEVGKKSATCEIVKTEPKQTIQVKDEASWKKK